MNGSRSHTSRTGSQDTSLDALSRTIEGLEARIEGLIGAGNRQQRPDMASPGIDPADPLADIRARQKMLESRRLRLREDGSESRAEIANTKPVAQVAPAGAIRGLAEALADMRRDLKVEIRESLASELGALRQDMRMLSEGARKSGMPEDLRHDLARLSASVDRIGDQGNGADGLRLELDSMRTLIGGLARQDSVHALEQRWQAVETQVSGLDVGGLREELVGLAYRVDDIREALAAMPDSKPVQALEAKIATLSRSIEDLARQPGAPAAEMTRQFDLVAGRLDEITRAIVTLQPAAVEKFDTAPLERLEARLNSVAKKIDAMAPGESSVLLAERIETLAARVGELADEEAIGRLDARLERLQLLVESGQGDASYGPELSTHMAELSVKIDRIDTRNVSASLAARLDDLAARIDAIQMPFVQESQFPETMFGRLELLVGRAEATASRPVDPLPGMETLEARIADIAAKLDRKDSQPDPIAEKALRGFESLETRLADIADMLDQAGMQHPSGVSSQTLFGLETVETRLSDLFAKLDSSSAAPAAMGRETVRGLENVEARLAEISARLDREPAPVVVQNDAVLRGLEEQIAHLSRLVSEAPQSGGFQSGGVLAGGALSGASLAIDSRLASIEDHLATNDEYVIEAARQAAEAALSAYSGRTSGQPTPQSIANIEIITALADDLKALETMSRKTEDRTSRAFEALQDTLLKIAGRLEKLDMGLQRPMVSAPAMTMPEASTAALDGAMENTLDPRARATFAEAAAAPPTPASGLIRSPAEAAAMAAAFATEVDRDKAPEGAKAAAAKRSFLSGLAARIKPGKPGAKASGPAEPRFTEAETPPLEPVMDLDPATANMPLEPGSGAPDINRILQKVREAQLQERSQGSAPQAGGAKAEFLASARRAAQAAAAEVETLDRQGKKRGRTSMVDMLKTRRKPILMAVGAILLAVMSLPLITGLLSGDGGRDDVTSQPAVVEPATSDITAAPVADAPEMSNAQAAADTGLPEVRVLAPPQVNPRGDAGTDAATVSGTGVSSFVAPDAPSGAPSGATIGTAPDTAPSAEAVVPAAGPAASIPPSVPDDGTGAGAVTADLDALPRDFVPAALRAAVQDLDPLALYEIGARFTDGRGAAVDLARAAIWYQRAADLGHAPSQYRLANFHEKGSGLNRDIAAAKKWYQLAAEQGNASAMHNLAVLYATAGPAPDYESAATWFTSGADVGVRDSQVNLAILYARGDGVTRDLVQSYKWFAVAANDGDKDAATKRDEVFSALRPEQAEAARAAVAAWKPQPLNQAANAVEVPAEWAGTDTTTASVDMTKAIRNIQAILNNNNFNAGVADGVMGSKTVSAIKAFQASIGVTPDGEITDALVKELLARNG